MYNLLQIWLFYLKKTILYLLSVMAIIGLLIFSPIVLLVFFYIGLGLLIVIISPLDDWESLGCVLFVLLNLIDLVYSSLPATLNACAPFFAMMQTTPYGLGYTLLGLILFNLFIEFFGPGEIFSPLRLIFSHDIRREFFEAFDGERSWLIPENLDFPENRPSNPRPILSMFAENSLVINPNKIRTLQHIKLNDQLQNQLLRQQIRALDYVHKLREAVAQGHYQFNPKQIEAYEKLQNLIIRYSTEVLEDNKLTCPISYDDYELLPDQQFGFVYKEIYNPESNSWDIEKPDSAAHVILFSESALNQYFSSDHQRGKAIINVPCREIPFTSLPNQHPIYRIKFHQTQVLNNQILHVGIIHYAEALKSLGPELQRDSALRHLP